MIDNHNTIMEENSFNKVQIEANNNLSLYERLYLGLPLKIEEYRKILNIFDELKKEENDVQNMIKKL